MIEVEDISSSLVPERNLRYSTIFLKWTFLQKLYTAAVWKATSERRGASFFLLYIRSPIGRAHKENQKTTNHKLWEHGHCCESILNRLTLEITTGEEQHNLVGGIPAHDRGFGIRSSLKVPSNLNQSVILQPCSAICVQYHSRSLYFQIILILNIF